MKSSFEASKVSHLKSLQGKNVKLRRPQCRNFDDYSATQNFTWNQNHFLTISEALTLDFGNFVLSFKAEIVKMRYIEVTVLLNSISRKI